MPKECSVNRNKTNCTCSYEPCRRRGMCCECITYHNRMGEVPGCLFPPDAEKTYDRSRENYIRSWTR